MVEEPVLYEAISFPDSQLSQEATRARRNLIAVFAVWMLVVLLELQPTTFTPLGIEFGEISKSIPIYASIALIYFWMSFIIYSYKDWIKWWESCTNVIKGKVGRISLLQSDIETVALAISKARSESRGKEFQLTIHLPREGRADERVEPLSNWEIYMPIWVGERQRVKKQIWQLRTDIYARSAWDYWLPGLIIAGPNWHLWIS